MKAEEYEEDIYEDPRFEENEDSNDDDLDSSSGNIDGDSDDDSQIDDSDDEGDSDDNTEKEDQDSDDGTSSEFAPTDDSTSSDGNEVSDDEVQKIVDKSQGVDRPDKKSHIMFKGVMLCATRHGCSGATNCDSELGAPIGR